MQSAEEAAIRLTRQYDRQYSLTTNATTINSSLLPFAKKGASRHTIWKKNYRLNLKKKEELLCFVALALILVIGTDSILLLLLHFALSERLLDLIAATTASMNMNLNVQRLKEVAAKVALLSISLYLIALDSPSMLLVMLLIAIKLDSKKAGRNAGGTTIFVVNIFILVITIIFPIVISTTNSNSFLPRYLSLSLSICLYLIADLALAAISAVELALAAISAAAAYICKAGLEAGLEAGRNAGGTTIFVIAIIIIIIFNDIMYTIMLTTTLSIIGFYGAGLILGGTLPIVDTLLRFAIRNSISDELPRPLPPGLLVITTTLPPTTTTYTRRRRYCMFLNTVVLDELLLEMLVKSCGLLLFGPLLFLYFMFPFVYYCNTGNGNDVGTTIITTINIALLAVYVVSSLSLSRSSASSRPALPSSLPSVLPCDEQQRRSSTTTQQQSRSRMMCIMNNILFENLFIILLKPTFLISYFILSFMKISIVVMMVYLLMEAYTTSPTMRMRMRMRMRPRSTNTSNMQHVLLLSSCTWLLSSFAVLLYVNNFLMIMHFVIMWTH